MRRLLLSAALVVVFLFVWMVGTGVAAANVLLGNSSVASSKDNDAAGLAEAFDFSAGASGTAQTVAVYVDTGSSATGLVVGLYADGGGHPGSLLASGSDPAPAAGQWNAVTLDSTPTLSGGTSYWLAVVGTGGQLNFRDEQPGAGRCSENSPQSNLTSLPSSWASGPSYATCSLSADVNGTASPTAPPTTPPTNLLPLNIGLPAVSGTAQQGQTLTASNGSWSNSPGSYAYQWQDCDGSGSNCTNISGATSSSYTLVSGDIGSTVRAVVTATNGTGSASAVSAATAAVTPRPGLTASFAASPAGPVAGQSVHFDGTASSCAAAPCSYTWADDPPSGGSWPLGSGQSFDFTFKNVGTKYVTLTVTDALSQTATVEHDVVVTSAAAPSNPPPSAPSNTALPAVSGTAQQGQTLTASNGSWSNSPGSYAYQWQDCDGSGSNCTNISGATSSSYTLVSGDVGDTLRAVVSATNAGGSASATSAATGVVSGSSSGSSSGSCDLSATPSSFGSQVSAATAGQTICLASGDYGTWTGTNKAITVKAAAGAAPTMNDSFGSGASGFTLDGMTGLSGTISGAAHDITIQNSSFTGAQAVLMDQMQNANIVFNNDHFPGFVGTARLWTQDYNASGSTGATPSGVVVEHSTFDNPSNLTGIADGVRCDGASIQILDNNFSGIDDNSDGTGNHGDPIQIYGGTHCIIKGNYFHGMINSATCSLGEWDGGDHNVYENNVVDTGGCYEAVGILADQGSLVDHNTFITPASGCLANPQSQCGSVATGAKSGQSGSGTVYRDNVMTGFGNGNGGVNASYSEDHNLCTSSCGGGSGDIIGAATLAGGAQPTAFGGFALASGSPGISAASDATNMGIQLPTGG